MSYIIGNINNNPVSVHDSTNLYNSISLGAAAWPQRNVAAFGNPLGFNSCRALSSVIFTDMVEHSFTIEPTGSFTNFSYIAFGVAMTPDVDIFQPSIFEFSGNMVIAGGIEEEKIIPLPFVAQSGIATFPTGSPNGITHSKMLASQFESDGGDSMSFNERVIISEFNLARQFPLNPLIFGVLIYNAGATTAAGLGVVGNISVRRNRLPLNAFDGNK